MNDWQSVLAKSASLQTKAGKDRKRASALLWDGAKAAIDEWSFDAADTDSDAEQLYADVLEALGAGRKGDASKVKTVALAVSGHGLDLEVFPNLAKAYGEAVRLTKTVKIHAEEDAAADAAIEDIAANGPKSSSKPEGAAFIVLSQGVDEAARVLLDALGKGNTSAHRALLRALSQEIAGRIKPAPKPKTTKAKKGAKKTSKDSAGAPKPATAKAPVKRRKAKPVEPEPVDETVDEVDEDVFADDERVDGELTPDMFDMIEDEPGEGETIEDEAAEEAPKPRARKGAPVRRKGRPVRR